MGIRNTNPTQNLCTAVRSSEPGFWLASTAAVEGASPTSAEVLRSPCGMSNCQIRPAPWQTSPVGVLDCDRVQTRLSDNPPTVHKYCAPGIQYYIKWHRPMHTVGPLHLQTPNFRSKTEQIFTAGKNPHISGLMQFKPLLFKGNSTDKSTRFCLGGLGLQPALPIPVSLSTLISQVHHACFLQLLDWLSLSW